MALTPENAPESMMETLFEEACRITREHAERLKADPTLAARLDIAHTIAPETLGYAAELNLIDRGMLPPLKHDEHPMAARLYARFKAGSGILTKDDAWDIANELDRLHNLVRKLERR